MSKYFQLAKHLYNQLGNEISLAFDNIQGILGFPLPESSGRLRVWWSNDRTHAQAKFGWLQVGWVVEKVDMEKRIAKFKRTSSPKVEPKQEYDATCFENLARTVMSKRFGMDLFSGKEANLGRTFNLVSADHQIIGNTMFLSGGRSPYSRFPSITERVWLLEKIDAKKKFIVFGNDEQVPRMWLERYGHLVKKVQFYFINKNGKTTLLAEGNTGKEIK